MSTRNRRIKAARKYGAATRCRRWMGDWVFAPTVDAGHPLQGRHGVLRAIVADRTAVVLTPDRCIIRVDLRLLQPLRLRLGAAGARVPNYLRQASLLPTQAHR